MKKSLLLFSAVLLMAFSCEKEELESSQPSACAVANPLQDLLWLKAEVERLEKNSLEFAPYFYIVQAEYKGETVFYIGNCCPMCSTEQLIVLNCKGEDLFKIGQDASRDNRIKNRKVIWKGPNFACNM